MRRFSPSYLDETRRGMWDSRTSLSPLSLGDRERILDVGCGTGALSSVLAEESTETGTGTVIGVDRDRRLLQEAPVPTIRADATELPMRDGVADLVICQALLVNLSSITIEQTIAEFVRCSSDLVAVIEPDNSAVTVESTIARESDLAALAREQYIRGVETDVTLGAVPDLLREHGLTDVQTRRYDHVRTIKPPYDAGAIEAAKRKATASRLAQQRETLLAGGMSDDAYETLRSEWREMGRTTVEAMQTDDYHRKEVTPFFVTVGNVGNTS